MTALLLSSSPSWAGANPCDGVEKTVCLSRVDSLVKAGRVEQAINGLSFLCTTLGEPDGCTGAANLLTKQNHVESARLLLNHACTSTVSTGCDQLAMLSLGASDYDAAAGAYDKACAQGEQSACVQAERIKALSSRRKALSASCDAGEPEPCLELATLDKEAKQTSPPSSSSSGSNNADVPDPTASARTIAKISAIRAAHKGDPLSADAQILSLCLEGEGYACMLAASTALIQGKTSKAKDTSEMGCREKSASSCFVRYSIAESERNTSQAEHFFGLTCQFGGLKYCAEVRKQLDQPERLPAAQEK